MRDSVPTPVLLGTAVAFALAAASRPTIPTHVSDQALAQAMEDDAPVFLPLLLHGPASVLATPALAPTATATTLATARTTSGRPCGSGRNASHRDGGSATTATRRRDGPASRANAACRAAPNPPRRGHRNSTENG